MVLNCSRKFGRYVILLTAFTAMLFGYGCGQKEGSKIPALTIEDNLNIVSPTMRNELARDAQELKNLTGSSVVVITVDHLPSTEPSGFADRAFNESLNFSDFFYGTELKRNQQKEIREEWSKRGILIFASLRPRLVIVRLGSDYRKIMDDSTLHSMMEARVYNHLLNFSFR